MFDKYKDNKEATMDEYLKLYADVRNMSIKIVSSVTVKYHAKHNLNLAVATKNRVAEMRLNLEHIPFPIMIHLHKHTQQVTYSDLLKGTTKVSRLQSTKTKIENQLR